MLERNRDHGLRTSVDDGLKSVGGSRIDVVARALVDVRGPRAARRVGELDRDPGPLVVDCLEGRLAGLARTAPLDEIDADRTVRVLAAAALLVSAAPRGEQQAKGEERWYRPPRSQSL
jgi:hypothetical protein